MLKYSNMVYRTVEPVTHVGHNRCDTTLSHISALGTICGHHEMIALLGKTHTLSVG